MDGPSLLEGEAVIAARPGSQKRLDLVEQATETRCHIEAFEPARGR
jgi:hypothetical protein